MENRRCLSTLFLLLLATRSALPGQTASCCQFIYSDGLYTVGSYTTDPNGCGSLTWGTPIDMTVPIFGTLHCYKPAASCGVSVCLPTTKPISVYGHAQSYCFAGGALPAITATWDDCGGPTNYCEQETTTDWYLLAGVTVMPGNTHSYGRMTCSNCL